MSFGLPDRSAPWIIGALATIALFIGGYHLVVDGSATPPPDKPRGLDAGPLTFRPSTRQLASLKIELVSARVFRSETLADGKIAIDDNLTTPVFSPYSGRVTRILAKIGDAVQQGQPLFAVEATEFVQGENDLTVALANVAATQTQLDVSEATEKRQHALYAASSAALKDWRQSEADLATAQSAARGAAVALAAVRNRLRILGKSDRDIAEMEKPGQMAVEAIVTAPISGTVIQRQVGVGQYIQSGASSPHFTIGDLSKVWLVANAREVDAPAIHAGQVIKAQVLAIPDRIFSTKVDFVAASVDPDTRRVMVRAEIDNPESALKPEMFARFSIAISGDVTAAAVPDAALVYEGDNARLWIALSDGSIELRRVRTGRHSDGLVEISSGLAVGEKIVTSGALFIDRAATAD